MKKRKKKKNHYKRDLVITIILVIFDLFAVTGFVLAYGPYDKLRNLFVNTAMRTMRHKYFAYVLYTEEMVDNIISKNYFVEITDDANLDDIIINTSEKTSYENEYEKELLTREPGNDLYKVLEIKVGGSNAHLVAIYHPEKMRLVHIEKFDVGGWGERLIPMCERYGAILCVNGGGFVDFGLGSDIPQGYVIENHEIIYSPDNGKNQEKHSIIGLTDDGKLKLMPNSTGDEAIKAGVRDGVVFRPFLIVNGKPLEIVGDPWGKSPRVAIGQRKDGVLMFLLVDGTNYINGASLQDLIDTLLLYGAYNASNLDGGQSSSLVVKGKLINTPPAESKRTNGRWVVTGFGLFS